VSDEALLAKTPPKQNLHALGLEVFEVVTMPRKELKAAPYNPRTISDAEKKKLAKGLKRHGLVSPITWNRKTGNVVGGHQRISIMDDLVGTSDYELQVAVIDVDESREKELNILLNNPQAQGDWDIGKLGDMLTDTALSIEGTGFDPADVFKLIGDQKLAERDDGTINALSDKLREAQARYMEIQAKSVKREAIEYFIVVVFRDDADCGAFLKSAGLPDNTYQSGRDIRRLTGFPEDDASATPGGGALAPDGANVIGE
jgi:ParB-like nuclease domain